MEPTRTNAVNYISGVYESVCHPMERIVLEGGMFPRCGTCDKEAVWTFVRKLPPNPEIVPGPVQPPADI